MRAAVSLALLLSACGAAEEPANEEAGRADVEALPADESAETSTQELAAGVNDPDANELGNQH